MTQPPKPPSWTHWIAHVLRWLTLLLLTGAAFTLPPGDRLWIVALAAPAYPTAVSGALRRSTTWRILGIAEPAGIWCGIALFVGILPNYSRVAEHLGFLPRFDWPYRPDILYILLVLQLAIAYGLGARRLKMSGWPTNRAVLVAVISWLLVLASAIAALFIGRA